MDALWVAHVACSLSWGSFRRLDGLQRAPGKYSTRSDAVEEWRVGKMAIEAVETLKEMRMREGSYSFSRQSAQSRRGIYSFFTILLEMYVLNTEYDMAVSKLHFK